jgi:DNA-binding MarR family transcriptional regulator
MPCGEKRGGKSDVAGRGPTVGSAIAVEYPFGALTRHAPQSVGGSDFLPPDPESFFVQTMPVMNISDQLAYILASVTRQLEEELQESLRPSGLPIEQFRILDALNRAGSLPMGELATRALVEPTTLTKIIDRMVADSLVFRSPDPSDRRRVLILLAPAGKAVHKRVSKVSVAQEERLAKQLDQSKAQELRALLREIMR